MDTAKLFANDVRNGLQPRSERTLPKRAQQTKRTQANADNFLTNRMCQWLTYQTFSQVIDQLEPEHTKEKRTFSNRLAQASLAQATLAQASQPIMSNMSVTDVFALNEYSHHHSRENAHVVIAVAMSIVATDVIPPLASRSEVASTEEASNTVH